MKILQIGTYLAPDFPGGAEVSASSVADGLRARGHSVGSLRWGAAKSFSSTPKLKGDSDSWRLETWRPYTPLQVGHGVAKAGFYALEALTAATPPDLKRVVLADRVDAIILHSFRGMGYGTLAAIADTGLPVVLFLHDYAISCINKSTSRNGIPCSSRCFPCRLLCGYSARELQKIERLTIIGPCADVVQRTTAAIALPNARTEQVFNPNLYIGDPRIRSGRGPLKLGYVGRIEHEKGIIQLIQSIDAIQAATGLTLTVAGTGSLFDTAQSLAATRPWLTLLGHVDKPRLRSMFADMDVAVVPSLWPDILPSAVIEGSFNGVPSIGFAIGGIPELIIDGVSGCVVPVGDFEHLNAVIVSFSNDPGYLRRMSEGAITNSHRFDQSMLVNRIVDIIEETAN